MPIPVDTTTSLLAELVRVESVNPAFSGGQSDEAEIADLVSRRLEALGLRVERREPEPGRVSVLGTLAGAGKGPSLLLYAHLDTVGVEGMEDPFGDFELVFGAARLGLKICEVPTRYSARVYGKPKTRAWRHGWMLLRMAARATRVFKCR